MAADRSEQIAPTMPFSPLDALLNCLPDLRRAGRVKVGDDVLSVQQRMADVLRPIVGKIRLQARREAFREAAEIARKHGAPFVNQASAIAAALEKESQK